MNLIKKLFSPKPVVKAVPAPKYDYRAERKRMNDLITEFLDKAKAAYTLEPKFQVGDQVTMNSRLNWFHGGWMCKPDHNIGFSQFPEAEVTEVYLDTHHAEDRLERVFEKLDNRTDEIVRAVFERFLREKEIQKYFYFTLKVKFKNEDLKISYGLPEYYYMLTGLSETQEIVAAGRKALLLENLIKKSQAELKVLDEQLDQMEQEKKKAQYQNAG